MPLWRKGVLYPYSSVRGVCVWQIIWQMQCCTVPRQPVAGHPVEEDQHETFNQRVS